MGLRPIFYDTETTGIKAEKEFIVELAAYDPVQERTFERFIKPGRPIPPEVTKIHKITDEMVADADPFSIVGEEFVQFCEGDVVLIAHNNDSFDIHFLKAEFSRNSLEMPNWKFLDSLRWARRYRTDLPKHSLQFLREIYGIPENNAHRALDDVIVLFKVWQMMTDDLSMDEAFALLNVPRAVTHMPFGKHQGQPLEKIPASYVKWLNGQGAFDKPENAELKSRLETLGLLT